MYDGILNAGLSYVVKEGDKILGTMINFDARANDAAPLCACAAFQRNMPDGNFVNELNPEGQEAQEAPKEDDTDEIPMSVLEFLEAVEQPLKEQHLPVGLGKTIYASMLGTAKDLSPAENVKV